MKILLVGSNPSSASATCEAFKEDTKSGRLLRTWLEGIEGEFLFANVANHKTEDNRPLSDKESVEGGKQLKQCIEEMNPDRIVGLGQTACKALKKIHVNFLEMPHPSGLNRLLNNKAWVRMKLDELRSYCCPSIL